MFNKLRKTLARNGKAVTIGTTMAGASLIGTLATADNVKPLDEQFRDHSKNRLEETRRDIRRQLEVETYRRRLVNKPTTALVARDVRKMGKK